MFEGKKQLAISNFVHCFVYRTPSIAVSATKIFIPQDAIKFKILAADLHYTFTAVSYTHLTLPTKRIV